MKIHLIDMQWRNTPHLAVLGDGTFEINGEVVTDPRVVCLALSEIARGFTEDTLRVMSEAGVGPDQCKDYFGFHMSPALRDEARIEGPNFASQKRGALPNSLVWTKQKAVGPTTFPTSPSETIKDPAGASK